ncbi:MAG: precorrin-8X methylmutase, partial [Oscillospiraceae bacterium]|nr:precorrin-8X methylmutase [Oscillospiraceae bacterium]
TADFDYADSLYFSEGAAQSARDALNDGITIVTDTTMALSGINKPALAKLNCSARCYIGDSDIAETAAANGTTRSAASMDKAAELDGNLIFAIGNAPTALVRLYELINSGKLSPKLIIAVPVGFVNVVQAKEMIMELSVPCIVARGRKGGSNVAAAIVNALLYQLVAR